MCMRDFAHQIVYYSQDATTDINAKYVKRRGAAHECTLFGVEKPKFHIYTPFSPKTAILGPDFDGIKKFSPEIKHL